MSKKKNTNTSVNKLEITQNNIPDNSVKIYQREKLSKNITIRERNDFTEKQLEFINLTYDKNTKVIFVNGPAGTSKTFTTIYSVLHLLNEKKISDIIYLRSVVESSSHSIGYLKGDLDEKMSVYLHPLMDKLEELLSPSDINLLMKENRIQGKPLNFIRGSHWAVKAVLFDEAQNATYSELYTLVTRMGEFSKLFILGDIEQCDIKNSGFGKIMNQLNDDESKSHGIHVFNFNLEDVVRSKLVKFLLTKLKK
jgi:phosphate starvation-inducible protein PhoH and related proteins